MAHSRTLLAVLCIGCLGSALAGRGRLLLEALLSDSPTNATTIPSTSLWSVPGTFAGVRTSDVEGGLNDTMLAQLYGPAAFKRAQAWVKTQKALWCGTADKPESEPAEGVFPFVAPPTTATYWPGACPASAVGQQLFDQGLAWRMLFNDNEAACSFRAASRTDPTCAMAYLGTALTMGPNVNYAFILSPVVYKDILTALDGARTALQSDAIQNGLAAPLYTALTQRYCVDQPGQLAAYLNMSDADAFAQYNNASDQCGVNFMYTAAGLAAQYPDDPNVAAIAAGALMEHPAWKWWGIGSVVAGANFTALVQGANNSAAYASTSMKQSSELIENNAAMANTLLQHGLNTMGDHLGLLHYMIHNMEQGPNPEWAQSVADRLYDTGGSTQGHASHMRTHIDMRVGNYDKVLTGNWLAVSEDAEWNYARSGGGIMSVLYKYNPHNHAFLAEAAQHAGSWKQMAAAITGLGTAAGFPLLADPSQRSLAQFLTRQLLQPLRFGAYEAILNGTNAGGDCPIRGTGNTTTVKVTLPGNYARTVVCGHSCGAARLFARIVSASRLGLAKQAAADLTTLIRTSNIACANPTIAAAVPAACSPEKGSKWDPVQAADMLAAYHISEIPASRNKTNGLNDDSASGTLTINNDEPLAALNLLVPSSEVAGAQARRDMQLRQLRTAVFVQGQIQYDEPAPFFYPVGETLAGVLMRQANATAAELDEAAGALRMVLYQWPHSALPAVALAEITERSPGAAQAKPGMDLLLSQALKLNDTAVDLAWL